MQLVEERHRIQLRALLGVYDRLGHLCDFDWGQYGFRVFLCCNRAYGCDVIACIVSENAIDLHTMHIPLYGGCMEQRKRRLPALRMFVQGPVDIARAAGSGLGVYCNTFWNRSEHRLRAHYGQRRGGLIVVVHMRRDGKDLRSVWKMEIVVILEIRCRHGIHGWVFLRSDAFKGFPSVAVQIMIICTGTNYDHLYRDGHLCWKRIDPCTSFRPMGSIMIYTRCRSGTFICFQVRNNSKKCDSNSM
jgi:hypothetical protein